MRSDCSKGLWLFQPSKLIFKFPLSIKSISLQAVQEPALFDECGLDENTKKVLLDNIQQKLTQQAVKIRADVEVACYSYEGIDAVKDALR